MMKKMTTQNYDKIRKLDNFFTLASFALGCWGFSLIFSPGVFDWKYGINEEYKLKD